MQQLRVKIIPEIAEIRECKLSWAHVLFVVSIGFGTIKMAEKGCWEQLFKSNARSHQCPVSKSFGTMEAKDFIALGKTMHVIYWHSVLRLVSGN